VRENAANHPATVTEWVQAEHLKWIMMAAILHSYDGRGGGF
jgi:hypothetical protein